MYEISSNYKDRKRNTNLNKQKKKWDSFSLENIKNNFLLLLKIILITVVSVLIIVTFQFESISSSEPELIEIKVVEGDNLWKIADRYYEENIDLRKKIFQIKKVNELDSAMLKPGQKIMIPISK